MGLIAPILQCLVDQEPTGFHQSDANGETFSFAVNLSLDCRGEGTTAEEIGAEETAAKQQFLDFLSDVQNVKFHLFSVSEPGWSLDYAGSVHCTSGLSPAGNPQILLDWLDEQKPDAAEGTTRYWSTASSEPGHPDVVIDADDATATHRLAAAQSWNAPVAHRFGLTHIVRIARDRIADHKFIILPYFDKPAEPPAKPEFNARHDDPSGSIEAAAFDYSYDPIAQFGKVVCRTNLIGDGITKALNPSEIDQGLASDGYLRVDRDAENVRRTLVWFEERAATLMAANPALHSRAKDPGDDPAFEELFGIKLITAVDQAGKPIEVPYWGSIVWYVVARLVSTLDNLVIALLKPTSAANPTFERSSEGDLLAPLVTAMLTTLRPLQERFGLADTAFEKDKITAALRSGLTASPLTALGPVKSTADLARALCQIYGIDAPKADPVKNERELISAIVAHYASGGDSKIPDSAKVYAQSISKHSVQILSRALLDLEQPLQDEAGAEAAIVKIVESAKTGNGLALATLVAKAYLREINRTDSELQDAVEAAFNAAWAAYRSLLDSPFNGAEATRRATGHSFVRNLLDFTKLDGTSQSSLMLRVSATESAFFSRRFGVDELPPAVKCFQPIAGALVSPALDVCLLTDKNTLPAADFKLLLDEKVEAIRRHLNDGFADAVAPLRSLNDTNARFIPDNAPQPLAIQIAANIDGSRIDNFARHLNGIGVIIQRADSGAAPDLWAHANLADLGWKPPPQNDPANEPPPDVTSAIHPMLPAVSDGRSPMFIEYQGFPFADRAIDARIVDNEAEPNPTRQRPFYRHDPHVADDGFARVPRLAFGRTFKTFGFVTSNAGTLPLALQLGPESPWMPKPAPQEPIPAAADPSLVLVGEADYQRRTAIAQMAVIESARPNRPPRIGAQIPGVKPLATDYPRVGLQAEKDEPGVRDILREADGSGKMTADQNFEWQISNIEFAGAPAKLTVRFFERPAADPKDLGDATFEIAEASVPGFTRFPKITIRIEFKPKAPGSFERLLSVRCGDILVATKPLSAGSAVAGWLRLVLDADNGKQASMTFANIGSQNSDNVGDPLLLLAPATAAWKDGLSDPVAITVSAPRIGYLDFDRWFANTDLLNDMFFLPGDDAAIGQSVELFERALITAYVMRHLDPVLGSLLDRLPDPAVEHVRIEIVLHDALIKDKVAQGVTHQIHPLKDKLRNFGRTFSTLIDQMITKENLPRPGSNDPIPWTPGRLRRYVFEPLDKLFQFRISLAPGDSLSLEQTPAGSHEPFSASVPDGVVARLSIDSAVPLGHFKAGLHPSVFHPGLMQYATRQLPGGNLVFPAAAVRIETMYDGMNELAAAKKGENNQPAIDLAKAVITAEGIERTRRFDLMTAADITDPNHFRQWRLLGEIDVTTQRWRTTGRPIYHYANPRAHRLHGAVDDPVPQPAIPLDLNGEASQLAQFELEAFFNRPDVDAHTMTHCLDPLPARNKLQEHYWNSESATYFRHRFTLRSRYAGALKDRDRGEVIAWPIKDLKTPAHGWTMRVAMLADLSRIQLTRPQLRALIPLTTAPDGDYANKPAPPVAAILQEPPFACGGLADRIAAEVKTGFGYGFEDDSKHVEIRDAREEAGPDPRLDYLPLKSDTALGLVLRSEGPLGLTFDNVDAPAPAYPNSMFSLAPATLFGEQPPLEELFVGIAMRRYIDPDWTMSERKADRRLDGERCWWLAFDGSKASPGALLAYAIDGRQQPLPLLSLETSNPIIEVKASKLAIDGVGATSDTPAGDLVSILKVDRAKFAGLTILHQPVAPGRYSTSIFVVTNLANTARGEINAPLMLGSFEWSPSDVKTSPDDPVRKPPFVELKPLQASSACVTMASAPTFLRWTKTSRHFDFLHISKLNPDGTGWILNRRHVRELVAALDTNHHALTFELNGVENVPVWLSPSTFDKPYPLHVHRHLGIITSHFLKELGRPVELFCRTAVLPDNKAVMIAPDGTTQSGKPYQPRDHVARIVEFETPAQIVCDSSVLAAKKYKTAYFDLVSTGFVSNASKTGGSLRFHFRIVGPPTHQRVFTELKIRLWQTPDSSSVPMTIPLKWTNTATFFTIGVQLSLLQQRNSPAETKAVAVAHLLRSDGTREKAPDIEPSLVLTTSTNRNPGLFVSVDAIAPAGHEFWTDISLLHSSNDNEHAPLDFDWLFSSGSEVEPTVSVSPTGLNMMNEAQARVISVSPPIPIVRH
ncbi:hypothetical protein [Nitrobacter sp. JJSN]|uniref:hypothetical protein n=1 Tax=Nitrobacter sp. JJSN TaxID=3453033 RepID=UPI003F76248F